MTNSNLDLDKFLSGDRKTLEKLYSQNFEAVERYVKNNGGSTADANDIFQNGLAQLFLKAREGSLKVQSFENYLFVVCRNLWRKEMSQKRVTNLDSTSLIHEAFDDTRFYKEHAQWELYVEKFRELSEACRELLTLLFGKVPYEDIVTKFSYASQAVARQRVFKCKARLVKLIQQDKRFLSLKK